MTREYNKFLLTVRELLPNLETWAQDALNQEGGDVPRAVRVTADRCREELSQAKERFTCQVIERLQAKRHRLTFHERVEAIRTSAEELQGLSSAISTPEFDSMLDEGIRRAERELRYEAALASATNSRYDSTRATSRLVVAHVLRELASAVAEIVAVTETKVEELLRLAEDDRRFLLQALRHMQHKTETGGDNGSWASRDDRLTAVRQLSNRLRKLPIGDLSRSSDVKRWLDSAIQEILEFLPPPPRLSCTLSQSQINDLIDFVGEKITQSAGESRAWGIHAPLVVIERPEDIHLPVERLGTQDVREVVGSPYEVTIRAFRWKPLQALRGYERWVKADLELQSVYGGIIGHSAEPWRAAEQARLIGGHPLRRGSEVHNFAATGGLSDGLALEQGD